MTSGGSDNLFRRALAYLGATRRSAVSYVQIGAMDGTSFDEAAPFIAQHGWTGLSVEPIPTQFTKLIAARSGPGNVFEQAAIVDRDGPVEMIAIDPVAIDSGLVATCFAGMSAVWPPRNGLRQASDRDVVDSHGRRVTVPGLTLRSVFAKHHIPPDFDLFLVDAEGYDAVIFNQLDLDWYRPLVIRIEAINLTEIELSQVQDRLTAHGYVWETRGQNLDAIASHLLVRLTTQSPRGGGADRGANLTVVTALYDLGRGQLTSGFGRPYLEYLERFEELLRACQDTPMVVYVDAADEAFVRRARRGSAGTDVRVRPLDKWRQWFPFFDRVQEIRTAPQWRSQAGWLADSPQAQLPFYNPLVLSKMFLVHDAVVHDPFATDHFVWLDAGLTRTVAPRYFSHGQVLEKLIPLLDRMLFVCFPYGDSPEVHGFERGALARYADGHHVGRVARGGCFGGHRHSLSRMNDTYYRLLEASLAEGLMGTEESLFSVLTYLCPEDVRVETIREDGLMGPFFERVAASADAATTRSPLV